MLYNVEYKINIIEMIRPKWNIFALPKLYCPNQSFWLVPIKNICQNQHSSIELQFPVENCFLKTFSVGSNVKLYLGYSLVTNTIVFPLSGFFKDACQISQMYMDLLSSSDMTWVAWLSTANKLYSLWAGGFSLSSYTMFSADALCLVHFTATSSNVTLFQTV